MNKTKLTCLMTAAFAVSTQVYADQGSNTGPFAFEPIAESANQLDWDPTAPWIIPEGFSQKIVSDETALNIYDEGRDDWHDMNTVNESGKMAGRYLYRTHEVRGEPEGGAVSVVDLKTGESKILAQDLTWNALDGIRWTPWGTVLFAEETSGGRLFEIILDKHDPMKAAQVIDRPAVGRLAHEGIAVDSEGAVYVVDEFRGVSAGFGGGIYKFVPDTYGDLSSGNLYVLAVSGGEFNTGQGVWLGPIDPADARLSGTDFGGASFQRPEDLEIIDNTLYVAVTEGPRDEEGVEYFEGRVLAINLETMVVTNFIMPGENVPVEIGKPGEAGHQSGWDSVDNLATTPDGKLVIIEDNKPSDIWIAGKDHDEDGQADGVWLFGSLTDPGAEGTGIYFGKDPKTLFVNVQHSAADDGDATWAISKD
ncbi:alkaline phosphatase PhoX [Methylomarinum sp. Ch1-1]|uniref:Alkaline phosphatase PhoX n=1 Tax=Methylomarinum roseum TaxID=3067653 RepID=A0AAU7NVI6_9GAMM|nr:alkaline phosphatase PhoX [Methylomarinum sp. Ch1-1]MDP4522987.1 DUF839 domain-containing protein [Methylomarinum sp. Ch1-1]